MSSTSEISLRRALISIEAAIVLAIFPTILISILDLYPGLPTTITNIFSRIPLMLLLVCISLLLLNDSELTMSKVGASSFTIFISLISYLIISLVWTSNLEYGIYKIVRMGTVITLGFFVLLVVISPSKDRRIHFLASLGIYSSIFSIIGLLSYLTNSIRYGGEGLSFILTARLAGISIIVMCILATTTSIRRHRRIFLTLATLSTVTLLTVGSRGPLVALILTSLGILCLDIITKGTPDPVRTVWNVLVDHTHIVPIIVFLPIIGLTHYPDVFKTLMRISEISITDPNSSSSARLEAYTTSLRKWSDAPFFGHGLGSFPTHSELRYPHNIFLEFLVETGIIGLLFFSILLIIFLVTVFRIHCNYPSRDTKLILSLFLFVLINSMVSGDLAGNRLVLIFFGFIGIDVIDVLRNS